jgi:hypothetical protein
LDLRSTKFASEHTDDGAGVEEAVPDDGGLSRRDEDGESGKSGLEHDGRMRVTVGRWIGGRRFGDKSHTLRAPFIYVES